MKTYGLFLIWAPALLISACSSFGAWHEAYGALRKELKVEGADGAPVTATTTFFLESPFTGFALVDDQGAPRPCGLLNACGSRISIHFDAKAGETLYLYPSTSVPLPQPGLPHRSGLIHLARSYNGSEVSSSSQFNALWNAASFQGGATARDGMGGPG